MFQISYLNYQKVINKKLIKKYYQYKQVHFLLEIKH